MNNIIKIDQQTSYKFNKLVTETSTNHLLWKLIAEYLTYTIPIMLVYIWFVYPKLREVSLRAAIIGVIGWKVLAPLVARIAYRERPVDQLLFPYKSVLPPKEVLFNRPDYSFPSDHAIFLFSIATAFYIAGFKQFGNGLFIFATLISLSRVVVGVHYLGDIIAGAGIGILLAWLAWTFRVQLDPLIVNPFIRLAKWIKLG